MAGVKPTVTHGDRLLNLQQTPGLQKTSVRSPPYKSSNCTFVEAVWQMMVLETNRYAEQILGAGAENKCAWRPTDVPEMMAFVALLLCMGINKRPRYSMHWSRSEILRSPLYSATMARNRFTAILRFFHLANNRDVEGDSPRDKLAKLRPLLNIVLPSFLRVYQPGRSLSPDETMTKFKGRVSFKQYMPRKAAKWGLKSFSLNESDTGYTCAWELFTGSQPRCPQGQSSVSDPETNHPSEGTRQRSIEPFAGTRK